MSKVERKNVNSDRFELKNSNKALPVWHLLNVNGYGKNFGYELKHLNNKRTFFVFNSTALFLVGLPLELPKFSNGFHTS